jgi:AbrB family looped-hinge helix DNA binding protein
MSFNTSSQPPTSNKPSRVRVDSAGRIVIPADVRQQLGIASGDDLVVEASQGCIRLKTLRQLIEDAQALFTRNVPPGVSVVDELLRERREEAERE